MQLAVQGWGKVSKEGSSTRRNQQLSVRCGENATFKRSRLKNTILSAHLLDWHLLPLSLTQRLCDEVFQREAASQDLIDAYLNHISRRKSRLPLFPDVSFSCPLLPAGATPRFSALYPHPRPFLFRYAPLLLFLRTFSSCPISLRSSSTAGFLF